jgi:oligoendopeptidase F
VTGAICGDIGVRAHIFQAIVEDEASTARLRGHPSWLTRANIENDIPAATTSALLAAVTDRYEIMQEWCRFKSALLGLPVLAESDRFAPVHRVDLSQPWGAAAETILGAYGAISATLRSAGARFFEEGWIDAAPRPGKRSGACCEFTVPSAHPYVQLSWRGSHQDLITLAHEIGHGVHGLLSAGQGIFHHEVPPAHAETVAVLSETLVLRHQVQRADGPQAQFAYLTALVDRVMSIVFRLTALWEFEDLVHRRGAASPASLGACWLETQHRLYGDTVVISSDGYRNLWATVPHFIDSPGYLYSYVYGQLLALVITRRLDETGGKYVEALLEMLRAGGSASPANMLAPLGIDLSQIQCWQQGLGLIEEWLSESIALAAKLGKIQSFAEGQTR